jgi:hypothetical protein
MDGEPPPEGVDGGPWAMDIKATEASCALAKVAPAALAAVTPDGLAAAPGALATAPGGLPQPAVEAPFDVVALARALLPTVPHPAIEYNLPVLQVERYILDALDLLFFTSTVVDSSKTRFHLFLGSSK